MTTTMTRTTARAARSGVARTGTAVVLTSIAGYALLAVVGRSLRPAEFGLFVAFWGVLFGLGSSVTTIEQETARRAAGGLDADSGPPVSAVTTAAACFAGLAAALTLLPSVAHRLYGRTDSWIGLVVVVAMLGFAVQFAVRGRLLGSGAIGSYARLVVAEAGVRLVVVLAVVLLAGLHLTSAAIAVGVGSFAWLAWAGRAREVVPPRGLGRAVWRSASARAGSLMGGAALTGCVITGFPTLVTALTGGAPGAAGGAVFAALTVSRVPLLLVSPIQALTVPFVVRASRETAAGGAATVRRGLVIGSVAFAALAAVGGVAAWVVGPWVVRLVYGAEYRVPAPAIALLVVSACLLAWTQLLSAALIALAAHRRMLLTWATAVAATVVWLVASPLGVVPTTAVGSLIGPLAALACALPSVWRLSEPATPVS